MSTIPSVDEMAEQVLSNWFPKVSEFERDEFINTDRDDLIRFHHGLGTDIRNAYGLWNLKWKPQLIDGIDVSPGHPDAVAMAVITTAWERLQ